MGGSSGDKKGDVAAQDSILEAAKNILLQLGYKDAYPQSIAWIRGDLLPDKPVLDGRRLAMNADLQGKLNAQEWRPLLASSFVLQKRMRKKELLFGRVFTLILSFVFFGTIFYFLSISLLSSTLFHSQPYGNIGSGIWVIALYFGLFFVSAKATGPFRSRLRFRADEIVSTELDMRSELLEVLQKIDKMGLAGPGRFVRSYAQPSVTQRIERLTKAG